MFCDGSLLASFARLFNELTLIGTQTIVIDRVAVTSKIISTEGEGVISAQRLMWLYFFGGIKTSKPAEKITPMQQ